MFRISIELVWEPKHGRTLPVPPPISTEAVTKLGEAHVAANRPVAGSREGYCTLSQGCQWIGRRYLGWTRSPRSLRTGRRFGNQSDQRQRYTSAQSLQAPRQRASFRHERIGMSGSIQARPSEWRVRCQDVGHPIHASCNPGCQWRGYCLRGAMQRRTRSPCGRSAVRCAYTWRYRAGTRPCRHRPLPPETCASIDRLRKEKDTLDKATLATGKECTWR